MPFLLIENTLEKILSTPYSGSLLEAAKYASLKGGKRLRPKLVILVAKMFGIEEETAILPACAIELIHTYSLIHDDLPCMDNDDFRREKPSLHKAFPEWMALLTGDFLLTYAFEMITQAPVSSNQKVELLSTLSKRAGLQGMLGGQELDLALVGKNLSWEQVKEIHLKKTAALIKACFEFGAILGEEEHLKPLSEIGELLGLCFQIKDDIEDESDAENEKPSAVSTLGKSKAKEHAKYIYKTSIDKLRELNLPSKELEDFINEIFS